MRRVSITEARRRLPQILRQLKRDTVVQITVRNEVVAEIRTTLPVSEPEPGAAARALLEIMRKLPKHRGRRRNISGHVKKYLYGGKV
jgi:antitoxin (DNA-binding transcriptional repressor) of toxin-antitoxin stability system